MDVSDSFCFFSSPRRGRGSSRSRKGGSDCIENPRRVWSPKRWALGGKVFFGTKNQFVSVRNAVYWQPGGGGHNTQQSCFQTHLGFSAYDVAFVVLQKVVVMANLPTLPKICANRAWDRSAMVNPSRLHIQKYPQYCWEFHDQLWEALSRTNSEKRGVPSRTGGERILETLWKPQMPWIIGFGTSQPYSRGEFQETLWERFRGLPEFFRNFFRKVPAVLGVWPTYDGIKERKRSREHCSKTVYSCCPDNPHPPN